MPKVTPVPLKRATVMLRPTRIEALATRKPYMTADESRRMWQEVGAKAMYTRLDRVRQRHRLTNTRHKARVITDNRASAQYIAQGLLADSIKYWINS